MSAHWDLPAAFGQKSEEKPEDNGGLFFDFTSPAAKSPNQNATFDFPDFGGSSPSVGASNGGLPPTGEDKPSSEAFGEFPSFGPAPSQNENTSGNGFAVFDMTPSGNDNNGGFDPFGEIQTSGSATQSGSGLAAAPGSSQGFDNFVGFDSVPSESSNKSSGGFAAFEKADNTKSQAGSGPFGDFGGDFPAFGTVEEKPMGTGFGEFPSFEASATEHKSEGVFEFSTEKKDNTDDLFADFKNPTQTGSKEPGTTSTEEKGQDFGGFPSFETTTGQRSGSGFPVIGESEHKEPPVFGGFDAFPSEPPKEQKSGSGFPTFGDASNSPESGPVSTDVTGQQDFGGFPSFETTTDQRSGSGFPVIGESEHKDPPVFGGFDAFSSEPPKEEKSGSGFPVFGDASNSTGFGDFPSFESAPAPVERNSGSGFPSFDSTPFGTELVGGGGKGSLSGFAKVEDHSSRKQNSETFGEFPSVDVGGKASSTFDSTKPVTINSESFGEFPSFDSAEQKSGNAFPAFGASTEDKTSTSFSQNNSASGFPEVTGDVITDPVVFPSFDQKEVHAAGIESKSNPPLFGDFPAFSESEKKNDSTGASVQFPDFTAAPQEDDSNGQPSSVGQNPDLSSNLFEEKRSGSGMNSFDMFRNLDDDEKPPEAPSGFTSIDDGIKGDLVDGEAGDDEKDGNDMEQLTNLETVEFGIGGGEEDQEEKHETHEDHRPAFDEENLLGGKEGNRMAPYRMFEEAKLVANSTDKSEDNESAQTEDTNNWLSFNSGETTKEAGVPISEFGVTFDDIPVDDKQDLKSETGSGSGFPAVSSLEAKEDVPQPKSPRRFFAEFDTFDAPPPPRPETPKRTGKRFFSEFHDSDTSEEQEQKITPKETESEGMHSKLEFSTPGEVAFPVSDENKGQSSFESVEKKEPEFAFPSFESEETKKSGNDFDFPAFEETKPSEAPSTTFPAFESTKEQKSGNDFGFAPFDEGKFESPKEGESIGNEFSFPAFEEVKPNEQEHSMAVEATKGNDFGFASFDEEKTSEQGHANFPSFDSPKEQEQKGDGFAFPAFEETNQKEPEQEHKNDFSFGAFEEPKPKDPSLDSPKEQEQKGGNDFAFASFEEASEQGHTKFPSFDSPGENTGNDFSFPAFEEPQAESPKEQEPKQNEDVAFPAFEETKPSEARQNNDFSFPAFDNNDQKPEHESLPKPEPANNDSKAEANISFPAFEDAKTPPPDTTQTSNTWASFPAFGAPSGSDFSFPAFEQSTPQEPVPAKLDTSFEAFSKLIDDAKFTQPKPDYEKIFNPRIPSLD